MIYQPNFRLFFIWLIFITAKNFWGEEPSTIRFFLKYRIQSLDPVESVDEASGMVLSLLHRRLYRLGGNGKIEPDLVQKEIVQDKRVILKLKDVLFPNQNKLTAEDVVFCLMRLKNSFRQEWVLAGLNNLYQLNQETIVIEYKKGGWSSLRSRLSLPKTSIYSKKFFLEKKQFMGLSPFSLQTYNTEKIVFSSPKKIVEFLVLPDEASRYFFFQRGQLTIYEADGVYRNLPYEDSQYFIYDVPGLTVLYGAIVGDGFLLSDPKFRRDLNRFFDRRNFCEKVVLNSCKPSETPVPQELGAKLESFFTPGEKIPQYKVPSDYEVLLYSPPDRERQNLSRIVQDLLTKMNIPSRILTLDLPSMIRYNNEKRPGIYFFKWLADYPHPENFLEPLFHSRNHGMGGNRAYYHNPIVDKILDNTNYSKKDIIKIQKIIQKDSPWLFVGHMQKRYFIKKGGFRPEPETYFWDWKSYWQ